MKFSTRRLMIIKSNSQIIFMISAATAITVFSLVASRALTNQMAYQGRVIDEKSKALSQIKNNVASVNKLITAYNELQGSTKNVISGNRDGIGDRDGDNIKIILDALPSKYDFPALTASIEKMFAYPQAPKLESITGLDDEINQLKTSVDSSAPVAIPFQLTFSGKYASIQELLASLQLSIRPISVNSIDISGSESDMKIILTAQTYYQPEKIRNIKTKVIK